MGKLTFYYGAMNSGKSIDLIRTAYNYEENNFNVIVMKPAIDTKADDAVQTRIGLERKVDYLIDNDDKIFDILKGKLGNISCIFIDEAQFLSESQIKELSEIAWSLDIAIICYGLRTDFQNMGFEGSMELLLLSDDLVEIKTLCSCGNIARRNARMVNGEFVNEGDSVVIDGENADTEYVPLCGKCYLEKVEKKDTEKIKKLLLG